MTGPVAVRKCNLVAQRSLPKEEFKAEVGMAGQANLGQLFDRQLLRL